MQGARPDTLAQARKLSILVWRLPLLLEVLSYVAPEHSTTHDLCSTLKKIKRALDTQATNLRSEEVVKLGQLRQIMNKGVQLPSEDGVHEPRRRTAAKGECVASEED